MNYYKKIFNTWMLATVALLFAGCKKGWLDINYNPQQITDQNAPPYLLLPPELMNAPADPLASQALQYWMGYWCPPSPYPAGFIYTTYNLTPSTNEIPADQDLRSLILLENKARQSNQSFYTGIAKVLKAMKWIRGVDFLNNIPYRESFQTGLRYPRYDEGKFIYEDQIKQLDSAILLIKNADASKNINISLSDIMFHGNKNKWIKFINTLKLRLLIHQANRSDRASYIQSEIARIIAEGSGFLNSGEDASVNPGFTDQKPNRFYTSLSKYNNSPTITILPDGGVMLSYELASANTTALNFLKDNADPRMGLFYGTAGFPLPAGAAEPFPQPTPDTYRGNKFGLPINSLAYPFQSAGFVSQIKGTSAYNPVTPGSTGVLKGYNMDAWVLTSIESLFLQAEAIQRGWLPGNPEQAYKDAVRESFRWLNAGGDSGQPGLSDAVFDNWYNNQVAANNVNVSWADAPDKYKLLMLQKWIAFNSIEPMEAYTDWRRNGGWPVIPPSLDPARISNTMPIRLPYSENEYVLNSENVNAQGTINIFTSKIWWMP